MSHVPGIKKGLIISDIEIGLSYREISANRKLSIGTVFKIVQRHKNGSVKESKKDFEYLKAFYDKKVKIILNKKGSNKEFSDKKCSEIAKGYDLSVTPQNVCNFLSLNRVKPFSFSKSLFLLNFTKNCEINKLRSGDLNQENEKNVIFCD